MIKVKIIWLHTVDIVLVPDEIIDSLDEYVEDFLEWVEGVSFDGKMKGTCFGTADFLYYLNNRYLQESACKAVIMKEKYKPVSQREIGEFRKMKQICF